MLSVPARSSCMNSASEVLVRSPESCGALEPGRPTRAKAVWLPRWSSMSASATTPPWTSTARALAMPATVGSAAAIRALSAVEEVTMVARPGRRSFRKRRHWAMPWPWEATQATWSRVASGCSTRQWWMSTTCSARITALLRKAKLSRVAVTGPSRAFSLATTP